MTIQTTYTTALDALKVGQLVDGQANIITNYTAGGAIGFGRGVIQGASDGAALIAASGGTLIGVALGTSSGNDGTNADGYVANDTVPVIALGTVLGTVVGNASKNAPAYVITTVGATQGQFTATPNALGSIGKFGASVTGGGIVPIVVSLAVKGEQGPQGEPA